MLDFPDISFHRPEPELWKMIIFAWVHPLTVMKRSGQGLKHRARGEGTDRRRSFSGSAKVKIFALLRKELHNNIISSPILVLVTVFLVILSGE